MIFDWIDNNWRQRGEKIVFPAGYELGNPNVRLSGDGNVVTFDKYYDTSNARAFVYAWDGTAEQWVQRGGDLYGTGTRWLQLNSISYDGMRITLEEFQSNGGDGLIQVLQWSGTNWEALGDAIVGCDRCRISKASLSGDGSHLIVGMQRLDTLAGYARVYQLTNNQWSPIGGKLEVPNVATSNLLTNIDHDGDRVVVATPSFSSDPGDVGWVVVFDWDGANWRQFGNALAGYDTKIAGLTYGGNTKNPILSGDGKTLIWGQERTDVDGTDTGIVTVYQEVDSDWQRVEGLSLNWGRKQPSRHYFDVSEW